MVGKLNVDHHLESSHGTYHVRFTNGWRSFPSTDSVALPLLWSPDLGDCSRCLDYGLPSFELHVCNGWSAACDCWAQVLITAGPCLILWTRMSSREPPFALWNNVRSSSRWGEKWFSLKWEAEKGITTFSHVFIASRISQRSLDKPQIALMDFLRWVKVPSLSNRWPPWRGSN